MVSLKELYMRFGVGREYVTLTRNDQMLKVYDPKSNVRFSFSESDGYILGEVKGSYDRVSEIIGAMRLSQDCPRNPGERMFWLWEQTAREGSGLLKKELPIDVFVNPIVLERLFRVLDGKTIDEEFHQEHSGRRKER